MVVLGGLEQYSEQTIGPRAAAQRQHCLIQVLLGLQGQQQLNAQEKKKYSTWHFIHHCSTMTGWCCHVEALLICSGFHEKLMRYWQMHPRGYINVAKSGLGPCPPGCFCTSFSMKNMSICWPKASVTFCSSSLIFSGLWNGMILGNKERQQGQRSEMEAGVVSSFTSSDSETQNSSWQAALWYNIKQDGVKRRQNGVKCV